MRASGIVSASLRASSSLVGTLFGPLFRRSFRPVEDERGNTDQRQDLADVGFEVRSKEVDCSARTRTCPDESRHRTQELFVLIQRFVARVVAIEVLLDSECATYSTQLGLMFR